MNKFLTGLLLVFYWRFSSIEAMRIVCYFDSTATQRQGAARFTVDNINTSLCTHLVYSKARINETTLVMKIGDEKNDINDKGYEKFVALKTKNPEIKVMIGLGGWNIGEKYKRLHSNPENIKSFVQSAVDFLQKYKFDGIHFDLQFLYSTGHKDGVTALLTALKDAFQTRGFLLSATVSPLAAAINNGYHVPGFNNTLDFVNIMAFNFHGPWEDEVDHHAPLYRRSWDSYGHNFNADAAVNKWIAEGIPPSKIVLGIPIFGNSWTLQSNETKPTSPANGDGPPGKVMKSSGSLSYYEICDAVQNDGWQVFRDPNQLMGPYAVSPSKNRTWVGYDDPQMASVKANYIIEKKLGGASVWDVSLDDFLNSCGQGPNPVLTAIANTLRNLSSTSTFTARTTERTTTSQTTDVTSPVTEARPSTNYSTESTGAQLKDTDSGQTFTTTSVVVIVMASLFIFAIICAILLYVVFGKPKYWRRAVSNSRYSHINLVNQ